MAAGPCSPRISTSSPPSPSASRGSPTSTLRVTEWNGDVVFLHEVMLGAADRSYGMQVARLAGLPPSVIDRAKTILGELEQADRERPKRALVDDLPLFAAARPAGLRPARSIACARRSTPSIPTR